MDERILQFRVGVMVVVTLLLGAILVALFDRVPFLQSTYSVSMVFPQAPGVSESTPIRKSGLLIGRVTAVEFEGTGILVRAAINRDVQIQKTNLPIVRTSLFGDAGIEFVPSGQELPDTPLLAAGDRIQGTVAADPLQVVGNIEERLTLAINNVSRTAEDIGTLSREVTQLIQANEDEIGRVITKAEQTLDRIQKTSETFDEFVSDPQIKENLKRTLNEVPGVLESARLTFDDLRKTVATADRNLQNLESFTKPLSERGSDFAQRLDRGAANLEEILEQLAVFSEKLNAPDSTLGRLVSDPALYQNINEAAENIRDVTRRLRPIVEDARVFSDKIARHPESLGVRGALRPGDGTK